jgi:hypothetical protein
MVRQKVIEVVLDTPVVARQSSASEEAYQMDNQNFWSDLGGLSLDVEKLDCSELRLRDPNGKSLVKRIHKIMEEYIR